MQIDGRPIGRGQPPYIIAEVSGNHGGVLDKALALIDAAKQAGADAVKLQTYTADTMTLASDRPEFRIDGGLWAGRTLHDLYNAAHTPWDWHPDLFAHARRVGITLFSSPFDPSAVAFLQTLDAPAYKIASYEIVDHGLIRAAARTGRPLIISTGLATLGEIEEAVSVAHEEGAGARLALLHCVSGYPTPIADCNAATIPHLAQAFGVPVGLSDHTTGLAAAVTAVALGACIIEKHLRLDGDEDAVDAAFSLTPTAFAELIRSSRDAWAAIGHVNYGVKESERGGRAFRRSLYVVRDLKQGQTVAEGDVRAIRPGLGLAPKHLGRLIGCRARRDVPRGTPADWNLFDLY